LAEVHLQLYDSPMGYFLAVNGNGLFDIGPVIERPADYLGYDPSRPDGFSWLTAGPDTESRYRGAAGDCLRKGLHAGTTYHSFARHDFDRNLSPISPR
jgi:hypothetical protein